MKRRHARGQIADRVRLGAAPATVSGQRLDERLDQLLLRARRHPRPAGRWCGGRAACPAECAWRTRAGDARPLAGRRGASRARAARAGPAAGRLADSSTSASTPRARPDAHARAVDGRRRHVVGVHQPGRVRRSSRGEKPSKYALQKPIGFFRSCSFTRKHIESVTGPKFRITLSSPCDAPSGATRERLAPYPSRRSSASALREQHGLDAGRTRHHLKRHRGRGGPRLPDIELSVSVLKVPCVWPPADVSL